jgi:3-oxoacyl-[acyl-carrier-protein] synthase-3
MRLNSSAPLWQDRRSVDVLGTGSALPGKEIPTSELLERMYTHFGVDVRRQGAALADRLGIHSRHVCRDFVQRHETPRSGDTNAELAARAVLAALGDAGVTPSDLDYLIAHTTTPGRLLPPNVAQIADLIGYRGPFVELRQACTGFANALVMAFGLLHAPNCGPVAIVGSETGSVFFDPRRAAEDSGQLVNLVQMGDAAGACILAPGWGNVSSRISNVYYGHVGCGRAAGFSMTAGGSDLAPTREGIPEFEHDYRSVVENGAALFVEGLRAAERTGIDPRAVDFFIPHQVNGRMAKHLATHLEVDESRIFVNADRVGNAGSAAIWLALADLRARLCTGDTVCVLGAEATKYMFGGFLYVHV